MSGHVLRFTKSVHQRTQELLPWFVTGTLEAEESAAVKQHLQGCPDCRSELDCVRTFQAAYVSCEIPPDTERALAKLRMHLDAGATAPTVTRERPAVRLSNLLGRTPIWTGLALTAQFVVIFALGWEVVQTEPVSLEYHALASAGTPARMEGSLIVVFDRNAPQREVARILRRSGVRVVDGPTASNGYVLAIARGSVLDALRSLRAEPAVVLAEPLAAPTTP